MLARKQNDHFTSILVGKQTSVRLTAMTRSHRQTLVIQSVASDRCSVYDNWCSAPVVVLWFFSVVHFDHWCAFDSRAFLSKLNRLKIETLCHIRVSQFAPCWRQKPVTAGSWLDVTSSSWTMKIAIFHKQIFHGDIICDCIDLCSWLLWWFANPHNSCKWFCDAWWRILM